VICDKLEATFDGMVDHSSHAHPLVEDAAEHSPGVFRALNFSCEHARWLTDIIVFLRRMWHTWMGQVLRCLCGLPFKSIQHLGVHWLSCRVVDPLIATGPSLYSWAMHAWLRNRDQMRLPGHDNKAGLQLSGSEFSGIVINDLVRDAPNSIC
jgi:hypothetical protein